MITKITKCLLLRKFGGIRYISSLVTPVRGVYVMATCVCRTLHGRLQCLLVVAFSSSLMLVISVYLYLFVYYGDDRIRENLPLFNMTIPTYTFVDSTAVTTVEGIPVPSESPANTSSTTAALTPAFKVTIDGKVPERVFIPEGGNIHFNVRTTPNNYQKRLPLVFLTWILTVPPNNVSLYFEW